MGNIVAKWAGALVLAVVLVACSATEQDDAVGGDDADDSSTTAPATSEVTTVESASDAEPGADSSAAATDGDAGPFELDSWSSPDLPPPVSPMTVTGELVLFEAVADDALWIVAVDAATGEERYRVEHHPTGRLRGQTGSVRADEVSGRFYRSGGDSLVANDLATGDQLWAVPLPGANSATIEPCGKDVCVRAMEGFGGRVTVFDGSTGAQGTSAVVSDDRVLASTDDGFQLRPGRTGREPGQQIRELVGHTDHGLNLAWSFDAAALAERSGSAFTPDRGWGNADDGQTVVVYLAPVWHEGTEPEPPYFDIGMTAAFDVATGELRWSEPNAAICGETGEHVVLCIGGSFDWDWEGENSTIGFEELRAVAFASGETHWTHSIGAASERWPWDLVDAQADALVVATPSGQIVVDPVTGDELPDDHVLGCVPDEDLAVTLPDQNLSFRQALPVELCDAGGGRLSADEVMRSSGRLPESSGDNDAVYPVAAADGWWVAFEDDALIGFRVAAD